MTGADITGGCLCGAVRYRVPAKPLWASHCHCASCRRSVGGAFVTWAGFRRGTVTWTGAPPRLFPSSPETVRGFCSTCGASLSYESGRWPDETHLTVATFDDPTAVTPTGHVYWREHVGWIETADGLPREAGTSDDQ